MQEQFLKYINEQNLFSKEDKILLGVSGGIDSVVMLDLFSKSDFSFGIAHCNFNLRGQEADDDDSMVESLAQKYNVTFHNKKFKTKEYATENKISIQMAARELRYKWFDEIKNKKDYTYIAIAHNLNDVVETFLINISRGTGIKGLTGIKPKNDYIVRPLLFANRQEILIYSQDNKIKFREDSSNQSIKYKRNKIRHNIIPEFESINPNFINTIIENIQHFSDVEHIYRQTIKSIKEDISKKEGDSTLVYIKKLKQLYPAKTYLFEFLKPYNFSNQQISDILFALNSISGKQFFSPTHRLVKDRDCLIITSVTKDSTPIFYIDEKTLSIDNPICIDLSINKNISDFKKPDPNIAFIDYDLLEFPLLLRKWKKGDYFKPLGMKDMKKVSDFFIDSKLSIPDKENTWILTSKDKIVWIVGQRIDDRFKITNNTNNFYVIKYTTN